MKRVAAAVGEGAQVVAALALAGDNQIWNQSCSPSQKPFRFRLSNSAALVRPSMRSKQLKQKEVRERSL